MNLLGTYYSCHSLQTRVSWSPVLVSLACPLNSVSQGLGRAAGHEASFKQLEGLRMTRVTTGVPPLHLGFHLQSGTDWSPVSWGAPPTKGKVEAPGDP